MNSSTAAGMKPQLFDASSPQELERFNALVESGEVRFARDDLVSQLRELFVINDPPRALSADFEEVFARHLTDIALESEGTWVFFPWIATAIHVLKNEDFQKVRLSRNKNLISIEEQRKFYNAVVGIAGMSIGNSAALSIVMLGGARRIKLADPDTLALSNLNRVRAGVDSLGLAKVVLAARQIYLINPYAEVETFADGLTEANLDSFFAETDLVIDEFDTFAMKYRLREYARKKSVPLLSGADVGDRVVIDIERYDTDRSVQPFLGRIPTQAPGTLDKRAVGQLIAQLVGLENHSPRMVEAAADVGRSLVSWPQLGSTALLNGATLAYCARRILSGEPTPKNRVIIAFDTLFE